MQSELYEFQKHLELALKSYEASKDKDQFVQEVGVAILHHLGQPELVKTEIAKKCFKIMNQNH
jgi:hypothetical protein